MNADLAAAVRLMVDNAAREREAAFAQRTQSTVDSRRSFAVRRRHGLEARHTAKLARKTA